MARVHDAGSREWKHQSNPALRQEGGLALHRLDDRTNDSSEANHRSLLYQIHAAWMEYSRTASHYHCQDGKVKCIPGPGISICDICESLLTFELAE